MSTPTIGKQLNKLFEEIYLLVEDITKTLNYKNENTNFLQNQIFKFMNTVRIECEWDMNDAEREFIGDLYFEAGHNGVNAVYYPFKNSETNINNILFTANKITYEWEIILDCIIEYCENKDQVNYAKQLTKQISKILY